MSATANIIGGSLIAYQIGSVVRAVDRQSKDLGSNPSATRKASFFPQKDFEFFKFKFNLHLFAIYEFEIVYEDTCRQRILSDTRLVMKNVGKIPILLLLRKTLL